MSVNHNENLPIVTVICTCHNQGAYVSQALDSIVAQTYRHIELFIIENGSSDDSPRIINSWLEENSLRIPVKSWFYETPVNYCKAFNRAFECSGGKYLIDLAADDFFNARHLEYAVNHLQSSEAKVYFCNALEHLPNGTTQTFYATDTSGKASERVDQGDVFEKVIKRYVISSPTLVFDALSFREIGCYDEELVYEDFDILVRMAVKYRFVYGDYLEVNKRIVKDSLSQQQYKSKKSLLLPSTFIVCEKLARMVSSPNEKEALRLRLLHEIKHAIVSANFDIAEKMLQLYNKLYTRNLPYFVYYAWARLRWDFSPLYEKWRKRLFK
jgi:glycosyltransferase involved in cell wall biosynthesis